MQKGHRKSRQKERGRGAVAVPIQIAVQKTLEKVVEETTRICPQTNFDYHGECSSGRLRVPRACRARLPPAACRLPGAAARCAPPICSSAVRQCSDRRTPFLQAERKAVIKNADMSEDMQQDAVDCASQALEKYNIEKDIAAFIKKEFDKKYNPTWHCIVGRNFGSYVTHETKHFIYFYLGQVAILLFKSG